MQSVLENTEQINVSVKRISLKKVGCVVATVLAVLFGTIAVLVYRSVCWVLDTWSDLSMEEIVYHLRMPLEGTNGDMITDYLIYCVLAAVLVMFGLIITFVFLRKKKRVYRITIPSIIVASILAVVLSVRFIWNSLDVSAYVENQNSYSSFIDENYTDPTEVDITFPEQKRNLIYIYLESMEVSYADASVGGAFETNVIPELTELSLENENFSGTENVLNGASVPTGATWTMGAMFAQTSGLPLTIPIEENSMSSQDSFFPGITTLGDVLEQAGYKQELLIGSDAVFGGRELYFDQHGSYEMYDYNYSLENGEIPEGYHVWWGYEDEKLFENAKKRLLELADSDQPFNLTMLTVDTHFEDGYVCELCDDLYGDDQYSNVMACSSRQVTEFIEWVQEQPFYENTTIVISGDHLTMDSDYCENIDPDYERKVYTAYINAASQPEMEMYREYSTFDAFPTTLASLGCVIEGDKLGLGVNLFSDEATLVEKYGLEKVNQGVSQKSELMEQLWAGINRVTVSDITYNLEKQSLFFSADILQWDQKIENVKCAVWTGEQQEDLRWYDAIQQSENVYSMEIPLEDFGYTEKTYYVHTYLELENGEESLISTDSIEVTINYNGSEGEAENKDINCEVSIVPYDYRVGKFEVAISSLNVSDIAEIHCAVWAEYDQSDLKWYDAVQQSDGNYVTEVYASDFYFKEGLYQIHVYIIDDTGMSLFAGATQATIN